MQLNRAAGIDLYDSSKSFQINQENKKFSQDIPIASTEIGVVQIKNNSL